MLVKPQPWCGDGCLFGWLLCVGEETFFGLEKLPVLVFTLFLGGQLLAEAELFSLACGAAASKAHAMRL